MSGTFPDPWPIKPRPKSQEVEPEFNAVLDPLPLYPKERVIRPVPKPYKFEASDSIPDWANIRKQIIMRDDGRCRVCGQLDRLHVHHIDWDRSCNRHSNLVTLCFECHRQVHFERYRPNQDDDYPAPWGEHPDDE